MSNKMTATEFSNLCDSVRASVASLKSCREWEVENEARILTNVSNELLDAVLIRKNPALEERRADLLDYSADVIVKRVNETAGIPQGGVRFPPNFERI